MKFTASMEKFVLHWGEMGTRWGVNRTMAQIEALLFLADQPLCAAEIATILRVEPSNVSTSLQELRSWKLVQVVHVLDDPCDHFVTSKDPWAILLLIGDGRKRREIDPTLTMMRACVMDNKTDKTTPMEIKNRMEEALDFVEMLSKWYEQMKSMPPSVLSKIIKLGIKIEHLVGKKGF